MAKSFLPIKYIPASDTLVREKRHLSKWKCLPPVKAVKGQCEELRQRDRAFNDLTQRESRRSVALGSYRHQQCQEAVDKYVP